MIKGYQSVKKKCIPYNHPGIFCAPFDEKRHSESGYTLKSSTYFRFLIVTSLEERLDLNTLAQVSSNRPKLVRIAHKELLYH